MTKPAFIWDLDGTLLNSYDVIASSLHEALEEAGVSIAQSEIHRRSIEGSVGDFLRELHGQIPFDMERVTARNKEISRGKVLEITLMPGARQTLEALHAMGCPLMVYTHKGVTTERILRHLGIDSFFSDVVCSLNGFPRKPAPDALSYLAEKHGLDKARTFYVGDRAIDISCAVNAGVCGILYLPPESYARPTGRETHIIRDLREICPMAEAAIK